MQYGDIDTEGGKWWETNDNENYIAPGLVEGKELVVDDWEVRNVFRCMYLASHSLSL